MTHFHRDPVAGEIIDAASKVHRALGPGLLKSSYEMCLDHELKARQLRVERQVPVSIVYEGIALHCGYRLDLIVNDDVVIEIKSVEKLEPLHTAQLLTYLQWTGARLALLINFNCVNLMYGLQSFLREGNQSSQRPLGRRAPGEDLFPRAPGLGGGPGRTI